MRIICFLPRSGLGVRRLAAALRFRGLVPVFCCLAEASLCPLKRWQATALQKPRPPRRTRHEAAHNLTLIFRAFAIKASPPPPTLPETKIGHARPDCSVFVYNLRLPSLSLPFVTTQRLSIVYEIATLNITHSTLRILNAQCVMFNVQCWRFGGKTRPRPA